MAEGDIVRVISNVYKRIFSNLLVVVLLVFSLLTLLALENNTTTPLKSINNNLAKCNSTADRSIIKSFCSLTATFSKFFLSNEKLFILVIVYGLPIFVDRSVLTLIASILLLIYSIIMKLDLWYDLMLSQIYLLFVSTEDGGLKTILAIVISVFLFDFSVFNKYI